MHLGSCIVLGMICSILLVYMCQDHSGTTSTQPRAVTVVGDGGAADGHTTPINISVTITRTLSHPSGSDVR
jgi:hypothetical protein